MGTLGWDPTTRLWQPSGSSVYSFTVGHVTAIGQAVKVTGPGTCDLAQADDLSDAAVGLVVKLLDATHALVVGAGQDVPVAGLSSGAFYYLDPTTPGAITNALPSSGIVQPVGIAKDTSTLSVNVQDAEIAYDPSTALPLALWLKVDAGTHVAGGLLTQWDDQSGNGANATAAGGQEPSFTPGAGPNGLPLISTAAATKFMTLALAGAVSESSLILAASVTDQTNFRGFAATTDNTFAVNSGLSQFFNFGGPTQVARQQATPQSDANYNATIDTKLHVRGAVGRALAVEYWQDGILRASSGAYTTPVNATNMVLFALDNALTFPLIGAMQEVLLVSRAVSALEMAQVSAYLQRKYGIVS